MLSIKKKIRKKNGNINWLHKYIKKEREREKIMPTQQNEVIQITEMIQSQFSYKKKKKKRLDLHSVS